MNVGKILNNPTIGFRLDPGEPGIAGSAPASTSALKVIPHELGNIHRFESEALAKGGVVIEEEITLDVQKVGSYLTVAGGHSKAVILYSKDGKPVLSPDHDQQSEPARAEHLPQDQTNKGEGTGEPGDDEGGPSLLGAAPSTTDGSRGVFSERSLHVNGEEAAEERRNPEYNEALRDPEESETARVEEETQAINPGTHPILLQGEESRKAGGSPPSSSGMGIGVNLLV